MQAPEAVTLLHAAQQALASRTPAVWVSVVGTRGSAPRLAGAAMLVLSTQTSGSVGGGHLEHLAIELAREILSSAKNKTLSFERSFPLGAALGQCCGGAMTLRFEALNAQHLESLDANINAFKTLFLFGAGHVAQALVSILAALPLRVVWVDSRDAVNTHQPPFPLTLPPLVHTVISDSPEAELASAKAGDLALIMTHSHAQDEVLTQAALKRPELAYIGLIGSATKRRLFEQRLMQRGLTGSDLARVTCPIGTASSAQTNSQAQRQLPAMIAMSVAAQVATYL